MRTHYSDKVMEKYSGAIFDHLEQSLPSRIITYVINSKYRRSVILKNWLAQQLKNPSKELKAYCAEIEDSDDYDTQMLHVFNFVYQNMQYIGELEKWDMREYWQTAEETILANTGDCEDGAILIYVLARMKGVPANRLMLFGGYVQSSRTAPQGGHCWLGYKPKNYPHNYCFLDWCYYYTSAKIATRSMFYIYKKDIAEYYDNWVVASKYRSIWFGFNENTSVSKF